MSSCWSSRRRSVGAACLLVRAPAGQGAGRASVALISFVERRAARRCDVVAEEGSRRGRATSSGARRVADGGGGRAARPAGKAPPAPMLPPDGYVLLAPQLEALLLTHRRPTRPAGAFVHVPSRRGTRRGDIGLAPPSCTRQIEPGARSARPRDSTRRNGQWRARVMTVACALWRAVSSTSWWSTEEGERGRGRRHRPRATRPSSVCGCSGPSRVADDGCPASRSRSRSAAGRGSGGTLIRAGKEAPPGGERGRGGGEGDAGVRGHGDVPLLAMSQYRRAECSTRRRSPAAATMSRRTELVNNDRGDPLQRRERHARRPSSCSPTATRSATAWKRAKGAVTT